MIETKNKPYYDDFETTKGFLKVLFKPGVSVQTRELNQLQSILQNQIGCLADSIFKDGSVVKDGRLIFKNDVNYVKLNNTFNDILFSYDNFKGRMVYGVTSKIVASVFDGFNSNNSNPGTLYLNYLGSGTSIDNAENISTYAEGEVLQLVNEIFVTQISGKFNINEIITGENSRAKAKLILDNNYKFHVVYQTNARFADGETIVGEESNASCIFASGETEQYQCQIASSENTVNPIGFGSFAMLSQGVYYVDGYFVNVDQQRIIISEYEPIVSAKVGFNKEVKYIDATEDKSLYDNSNGEPNENAPGADRLYLNLELGYYNLYDEIPEKFIEILRVNNSVEVFNTSNNSQWSNILDLMAKRTYDESGNYTVNPFIVNIQEFLNENDNNGIYNENYFAFNSQIEAANNSVQMFGATEPGSSHLYNYKYYPLANHEEFLAACRDRVCIGINPGLAYVLGYEVKLDNKIYVPMLKARTPGVDNNSAVNIKYGNYCLVENVSYLPNINNLPLIKLCDSAEYNNDSVIGTARVKMITHHSGDYGSENEVFKLYLSDIKMNDGKSFINNVKSLGVSEGNTFKAKAKIENGVFSLNNIDRNIMIFKLPQNAVQKLEDVNYIFMHCFNGDGDLSESYVVDSDGVITLAALPNSTFNSEDISDYLITLLDGSKAGKVINISDGAIEREGTPTGTQVKIKIGEEYTGNHYTLIAALRKSDGVGGLKKKSLNKNARVKIDATTAKQDTIVINKTDGYRLVAVYESTNASTDAVEGQNEVTSNYTFDGGQRDNYYDLIRINRKPNTKIPSGGLLVIYDYFNHTAGDYFTAESYTESSNPIEYNEIPSYTSENGVVYNLKDCIDIRPKINDDGDGFASILNSQIIKPNSNFDADVSYYLPRIDLLEVDYLGNFKIKQGSSDVKPQAPTNDLNSMSLYYFEIPSYTENIDDIVKKYKENKRYTMRDIGVLDTRISAIENYILLTQNEFDVTNMPVYDSEGNPRQHTGFIADNFNNLSFIDKIKTLSKCSVDSANNILRPSFKLNSVKLTKDDSSTSTVSEYNGKYMIPKTDVDVISQTTGTSIMRMNANGLVTWEGNLVFNTSVNNTYNNKDQRKQNFGEDTEYLKEMNEAMSGSENTVEYDNVYTKWLGVN